MAGETASVSQGEVDGQQDLPDVEAEQQGDSRIVTTEEEIEAYYIVKSILREVIDVGRVTMRDRINYCGILLDDNQRKYICRLHFNRAQKHMGLFNADRDEERVPIDDLNHIFQYADQLKATVSYYENPVSPTSPPEEA